MTARWIDGRALQVIALLCGLAMATDGAAQDRIEDTFARYAAAHPNLAVALAVSTPGAVPRTFAAGPVRPGAARMATADGPWHIGSVAKSFTATLAMRLIEQSALDPAEPAATDHAVRADGAADRTDDGQASDRSAPDPTA